MAENSIKPRIRFKGYTDAWEQRKLGGEAEELLAGGDIDKDLICESGRYPVIANALTNDGIVGFYEKYYRVEAPAVTVSGRGDVGHAQARRVNFTPVVRLLSIKSRHNVDFLENAINRGEVIIESTGVPQLTVPQLSKRTISFPQTVQEEEKIGKLFFKIDNLITLHQREHRQKKNPFLNENRSLFREAIANAWEQRKLGDIGETYGGLSGKSGEDFGHGNAKFVTYMNVFTNPIADTEMTESIEIDSRQVQVKIGDVFFTTSSETPEEVGMSSVWLKNEENIYLNSFCFGYRPKITMNSYYLAYMLRSVEIREKIVFLAQGISRYNISKKKMMEITIPLPSDSEQSKLGSIFKQLDNLITLHQRQLEKLKNIKSALLEKMFV